MLFWVVIYQGNLWIEFRVSDVSEEEVRSPSLASVRGCVVVMIAWLAPR